MFLYHKQKILARARLIVKVEVPEEVKDARVMLEAMGNKEIDLVEQVTAVTTAQVPDKHYKKRLQGGELCGLKLISVCIPGNR